MPKAAPAKQPVPVWDLYRDGVTFSLLSKFVICRHRFWIRTVLGLRENLGFNYRIEYGNFLHAGFEAFAESGMDIEKGVKGIQAFTADLRTKFPESHDEIGFWNKLAVGQFRTYCLYWKKEDAKKQFIAQEAVFDAPMTLPSGRVVRLRGKIDELFKTCSKSKTSTKPGKCILTLQENKSKGEIDEVGIEEQLRNDFQNMLYLCVLNFTECGQEITQGNPVRKALYNLIARPLGSKHSPRQRKTETKLQFADRYLEGMHEFPFKHFKRMTAEFRQQELEEWRDRTLFAILEQLCDWWESICGNPFNPWTSKTVFFNSDHDPVFGIEKPNHLHYCRPYGIYDGMAMGYGGDYSAFIESNGMNRSGLVKLTTAFPELDHQPSLAKR